MTTSFDVKKQKHVVKIAIPRPINSIKQPHVKQVGEYNSMGDAQIAESAAIIVRNEMLALRDKQPVNDTASPQFTFKQNCEFFQDKFPKESSRIIRTVWNMIETQKKREERKIATNIFNTLRRIDCCSENFVQAINEIN